MSRTCRRRGVTSPRNPLPGRRRLNREASPCHANTTPIIEAYTSAPQSGEHLICIEVNHSWASQKKIGACLKSFQLVN